MISFSARCGKVKKCLTITSTVRKPVENLSRALPCNILPRCFFVRRLLRSLRKAPYYVHRALSRTPGQIYIFYKEVRDWKRTRFLNSASVCMYMCLYQSQKRFCVKVDVCTRILPHVHLGKVLLTARFSEVDSL